MSDSKSLPAHVTELRELVVTYAKQETVEPLKSLRRYILFGIAGSVFVAIGLVLLLLGALRALQSETGATFTGTWSFVPYVVVLFGCAAVMAISVRAISAPSRKAARR